MNKSQIFKNAHQTAKSIVAQVGNYMIAFSIALKEIYANLSSKSIKQKLADLSMSVWGESFGKPRIYVNLDKMNAVFGLDVGFYKTGSISGATLNGVGISNSKAYRLLENKIYFCLLSNEFVGTDLEPII